ncbi:hypothetical protein PR202_gb23026 [Eleusine coracana subsp. coracana]|uniref:WRKY domain-containing protein n=1 Tax=Eleusine coracana subsp. coracana TaxID=191504 RepID=A0AAV5FHZ2_ELECO|nr:hypothetical protein PR202_gb23026 [Eleusine coracana subsp. coracana]
METGEPQFYFRPLQKAKDGPAPSGYWRETGSTEYIYSAKRLPIGMKRTMEFYHGSAPSGVKTKWKMEEFTVLQQATAGAVDARLTQRGKMSICQLYIERNIVSAGPDILSELMKTENYRAYYRCTHRHSRGCLATKQVQRTDGDPRLFDVVYVGEHSCGFGKDQTEHSNNQNSLLGGASAAAFTQPQCSMSDVHSHLYTEDELRIDPSL